MTKSMTPEIGGLFTDYMEQRGQLKKMVLDLEKVKEKVDSLFPDQLTARNRYMFDEKIKSASALFSSLLEIRKEIIKSLKDEIELRRRFDIEERELDETDDEVRKLANRIEELSGVKLTVIEAFKPLEEKQCEELKPNPDIEPPKFTTVKEGYDPADILKYDKKVEEEEVHG